MGLDIGRLTLFGAEGDMERYATAHTRQQEFPHDTAPDPGFPVFFEACLPLRSPGQYRPTKRRTVCAADRTFEDRTLDACCEECGKGSDCLRNDE